MNDPIIANRYRQAQRLADLTKAFLLNGNLRRAERCLHIAETQLSTGDRHSQNAVANVYVFSLTGFLRMYSRSAGRLLPQKLRAEYHKQITAPGI